MSFIQIVDSDESFDWSPIDEATGKPYESSFALRVVNDDVDKEIRKKHTKKYWDKGRRVEEFDQASYVIDVLDYAIVGWTNVKNAKTGEPVTCTTAMKARLPEKWRSEVLRLCAGKEAGDVLAQAEQEKKRFTSISSGSSKSATSSPVA